MRALRRPPSPSSVPISRGGEGAAVAAAQNLDALVRGKSKRGVDMEMSVGAASCETTLLEKTKVRGGGTNSSDLDIGPAKAEAMGELKRITAEVDPDLETATITYLVAGEKSPALLFEN